MELIRQEHLPEPVRELTKAALGSGSAPDVKCSLYLPSYRLNPAKRSWQIHRLLKQAERYLSLGLEKDEVARRLALLRSELDRDDLLTRCPRAQAFAFFVDAEHFEVQELFSRCEPLVVVAASFHVVPLLRSMASEPFYRLVHLDRASGAIFRRDHSGLKAELKVAFPMAPSPAPSTLHTKDTARDLDRVWHNIADFAHALLNLQALDPRPLALVGDDKLRRVLIEDIRNRLTRPIFMQERGPEGTLRDPMLSDLVNRIDEAFTDRVADQPPIDVPALVQESLENGLLLVDLSEIYHAAARGEIDRLFVATLTRHWGKTQENSSRLEHHDEQQDHKDDCLIDDTVEAVLRHNGSVLFCGSEEPTHRTLPHGLGAILKTSKLPLLTH
jgi:hypothetical protein